MSTLPLDLDDTIAEPPMFEETWASPDTARDPWMALAIARSHANAVPPPVVPASTPRTSAYELRKGARPAGVWSTWGFLLGIVLSVVTGAVLGLQLTDPDQWDTPAGSETTSKVVSSSTLRAP